MVMRYYRKHLKYVYTAKMAEILLSYDGKVTM